MRNKSVWRKAVWAVILSVLMISQTSCGSQKIPAADSAEGGISFTDALGREVRLARTERVVSLYGSFAETWMLAGGTLVGVTEDAMEERNLKLGADVTMVGSVKSPNVEILLGMDPDFVILSADVPTQMDLQPVLEQAQIPHAYFRVDTVSAYVSMLELFTTMTGRTDLYETYGTAVEEQISGILRLTEGQDGDTALLLRAYSTGIKAKGADNLAGVMLQELGVDNIVERHASMLEDLSIEAILEEDPARIFVLTMGEEEAALEMLENSLLQNPAWNTLSAVKNDAVYILPKEMFHYKPNARWAESYAYLAKCIYPQLTEEIDEIME